MVAGHGLHLGVKFNGQITSQIEVWELFLPYQFLLKKRNIELRHRADIDRVETMLKQRRLRWLSYVQRIWNSRLPKQLLANLRVVNG